MGIGEYDLQQRISVYQQLVMLAPNNKEYSQKLKVYNARSVADAAQAKAKERAQLKAKKRREGVQIGMSKQDVLDSSWGRPNHVNSTTTVYGTREQWVYGDYGQRGFLYFDGDTLTPDGADVFGAWFDGLRDRATQARIAARIDRLALGLFDDARALRDGVHELRIDFGPGYRVYCALAGRTVVLLLCGGDKRTQRRDITRAVECWHEFERKRK